MIKSAEIFGLNILSSIVKNKSVFLVLVFIFSTVFHERQKLFQRRGKCNLTSRFLSQTSFHQPYQRCHHQGCCVFFPLLSKQQPKYH